MLRRRRIGGRRYDAGLQGRDHLAGALKAVLWALLQQAHHDLREIVGRIRTTQRHRHRHLGEMLHQQRRCGAAGERRFARQHLVGHDAQRIEIAARIEITITGRLFRRHVRGRADRHTRGGQTRRLATVARGTGNTEVGDQRPAVDTIQQNVVGLDIAMNHPARVRKRQRIGHFEQPAAYVIDGERSALLQLRGEVVPVDAGHHEEHQIPDFVDRINRDDVRMTQLGGRLRLAQKTRADVTPKGQLRRQQLDRHEPFEALVLGPIHDAHATTTDFPIQFIGGAERLLHMGAQLSIFGGWGYEIGHSRWNGGESGAPSSVAPERNRQQHPDFAAVPAVRPECAGSCNWTLGRPCDAAYRSP